MDWDSVWGDVISGTIVLIIGAVGGWIAGLAKGSQKSSLAVERKNEIYIPLLNELTRYSNFEWDILTEIKTPRLFEIINNDYKYGIEGVLREKCIELYNLINSYSQINPINIAHNIIVIIFKEAYKEIYGDVVAGISYHSDRDGNEYEIEEIAEPINFIERLDYSQQIRDLLFNENMCSDEVCIDSGNKLYEPIYRQLKNIYALSLYVCINGEKYNLPNTKIDLKMLPEEYMAYHYDFFKLYNEDKKIIEKHRLREEINYLCQGVVQDLKDLIGKIVKMYEVEQV